MQWHKIVFLSEILFTDNRIKFLDMVRELHQQAGCPKDFTIFSEIRDNRFILYFSPIAAHHCTQMISSLQGEPCDLPLELMPSWGKEYPL